MDGEDLVHAGEVEGNAAPWCQDMAFDRAADTVGNDRHALLGAEADDGGDFFRTFRHHHAVGRLRGMYRLVAAMLQAGRFAEGETLLELLLEGLDQGGGKGLAHVRNRVAWSRS